MTTSCGQIRSALTAGQLTREDNEVGEHLALCADCTRFATRLEVFRSALRDHHAGIEPDAAFAARLRGRIPDTPIDLLGKAAWRLLPFGAVGTLALAGALVWSAGGFGALGQQVDAETLLVADTQSASSPIDDPLGWLLETPVELSLDDGTAR